MPIEQGFAVLGLADKFNGPGAVRRVERAEGQVQIELSDGGELLAWSERAPRSVEAGGLALAFRYEPLSRALRVPLNAAQARASRAARKQPRSPLRRAATDA